MKKQKILIIRFSSIGDIVLTTPVIRCTKEQLDHAEIHFCTKKKFANIVEQNPYIDKIHYLEDSIFTLIHQLQAEKFDFIADLHHNLKTKVITSRLRCPTVTFDKLNLKKLLFTKLKVNLLPNRHIVDRYMDTVKKLGVKNDGRGLDYYIPDKDHVELSWLPEPYQKEYIAVVIGGTHATKRLPYEKLVQLCDKINKPVVLLGGSEDAEMGEKIETFFKRNQNEPEKETFLYDKMNKKAIVFNACGKFNLNQSASLVKQSRLVFTHDTGLMHVAAAFKKEVFSIWGNTTPLFGMYPYKTKFTVLENNKLDCRPCSKLGYAKCPKGHFKCMKEVDFTFYIP